MQCKCGEEMREGADGITEADVVTVVWECEICGRTVEKEFHPINEQWTEPNEQWTEPAKETDDED